MLALINKGRGKGRAVPAKEERFLTTVGGGANAWAVVADRHLVTCATMKR